MKVYVDKRVVIEMTVEEADEFYREHRPAPRSIGRKLDAAIVAALDAAEAWPSS